MTSKPAEHDCWEHNGETMRKFNMNDQVEPEGESLTQESASWGPRKMNDAEAEIYEMCEVFTISNSVQKKIYGQTYWFHELAGWARVEDGEQSDEGDWKPVNYFGPFNAADLAAVPEDEQVELR